MNKILALTITTLALTIVPSYADIDITQSCMINDIKKESVAYDSIAKSQLNKSEYKKFVSKLNEYKTKLDTMKNNMEADSTVYYDLKDYKLISYQMYNLSSKYKLNLEKGVK